MQSPRIVPNKHGLRLLIRVTLGGFENVSAIIMNDLIRGTRGTISKNNARMRAASSNDNKMPGENRFTAASACHGIWYDFQNALINEQTLL